MNNLFTYYIVRQEISMYRGNLMEMDSGQAEMKNIDKQLVYQCRCSFLEVISNLFFSSLFSAKNTPSVKG